MFLMEVRDRAFHVGHRRRSSADWCLKLDQVLLKKSGDATPLVHSMRIGKSHSDVTIVLVGALSKWVNTLPDEEVNLPRTKALLRALRESEVVLWCPSSQPASLRNKLEARDRLRTPEPTKRPDCLVHADSDYERRREMGPGSDCCHCHCTTFRD